MSNPINAGHNHPFNPNEHKASYRGARIMNVYRNSKAVCQKCGKNRKMSKQSCDLQYCPQCWKVLCQFNDWDFDLSKCANKICDKKEFGIVARKLICLSNIIVKLGLSDKKIYRHLSDKRRKLNLNESRLNSEIDEEDWLND